MNRETFSLTCFENIDYSVKFFSKSVCSRVFTKKLFLKDFSKNLSRGHYINFHSLLQSENPFKVFYGCGIIFNV